MPSARGSRALSSVFLSLAGLRAQQPAPALLGSACVAQVDVARGPSAAGPCGAAVLLEILISRPGAGRPGAGVAASVCGRVGSRGLSQMPFLVSVAGGHSAVAQEATPSSAQAPAFLPARAGELPDPVLGLGPRHCPPGYSRGGGGLRMLSGGRQPADQ